MPTVDQPPPQIVPLWVLLALAVALWLCVAAWTVVVQRLWRRQAVLAYEPRRHVPWQGLDLLLVLLVYIATAAGAVGMAHAILADSGLTKPPAIQNADSPNAAHTVIRLLGEGTPTVLFVCAMAVVVVAPLTEEFLFRVLLQGWLEVKRRRLRRWIPTLRRIAPGSVGPIVLTSVLFARMHFRVETPLYDPNYVMLLVAGNAAASVLTVLFAVWLTRVRVGATAADLGWVPAKFFADVRLGLMTFFGVAAPIYLVQMGLASLLPKYVAPDPLTLFLFALFLGTLYARTHRIVPSIVLHMSLNATSLAMALAMGRW